MSAHENTITPAIFARSQRHVQLAAKRGAWSGRVTDERFKTAMMYAW